MILPVMVERIEISMITERLEFIRLSISKGATFCQVRIRNKVIQAIFFVILGSQKWRGAPPSFKTKERIIKTVTKLLENMEYQDKLILYMITDAMMRTLELILWMMKYFIEASASSILPLIFIKGKKPIRLSSNPIHIVSQ